MCLIMKKDLYFNSNPPVWNFTPNIENYIDEEIIRKLRLHYVAEIKHNVCIEIFGQ